MKNLLTVLLILTFFSVTFADIPAPPVAQEIRTELSESYPDYQFYLCSYLVKVKPNPNPPYRDFVGSIPESYEQKPVELPFTLQIKSFIQYRGDKVSDKAYWLAAIKKSEAQELEAKVKDVVLNSLVVAGIKAVRLQDSLELPGKVSEGAKVVVNKISLNEKGMSAKAEESTLSNKMSCFGLGLLLTGIVLFGGLRKRKKYLLD